MTMLGGGEEEEERKEGEEVGKEVNPSQGDDVGHWSLTEEFNGSEVEVVSSEEAESEEEEEEEAEDEDYGAMIKEMTALLSKEDSPIKPVQVERSMRGNEEEEEEDDHEFHGEDEGSIHQRIEELRMLLEEKMGFERFFQAYQYMKEVKDDDEEGMVSDKITELMGEGFQELFPSLMQLLACEATTYGN
uniref:Uncharacterized protein n=1 Tax=Hanusia phi TaxID=3032 RepID=A0A7S0F3T9_9CRYP